MRISLRRIRDVIVDNVRNARNIDAARCNIRRYENLVRAVTETIHCALSVALRHVALQRSHIIAVLFQLLCHKSCALLGACKDEYRLRVRVA